MLKCCPLPCFLQVLDRWLLYNLNAGLGAMDRIEYIWLGDSASLTWKPASRVVGTEGEFHINLTASTLGSVLLRVRTCDTTNKCTEESSFIISVRWLHQNPTATLVR